MKKVNHCKTVVKLCIFLLHIYQNVNIYTVSVSIDQIDCLYYLFSNPICIDF